MKKNKLFLSLATISLLLFSCTTTTSDDSSSEVSSGDSSQTSEYISGSSTDVGDGTSIDEDTTPNTPTVPDTDSDVVSADFVVPDGAITIALADGNSTTSDTTSVTIKNKSNSVAINSSGTYYITGVLPSGFINVKADGADVVLLLNGVSITSLSDQEDSPISSNKKVNTVTITSIEGSVNYICDNRSSDLIASNDLDKGAINTKAPTTYNGKGTLKVAGNGNNGIQCSKSLIIEESKINVFALNNGIKANLGITFGEISKPDISIKTSTGDGISNDGDEDTLSDGSATAINETPIEFYDGTYNITAYNDGIQASLYSAVNISGGTFSIFTAEGYDKLRSDDSSAKGIKSEYKINISGGDISINSYDDGLHAKSLFEGDVYDDDVTVKFASESELNITGGKITIYSGDDGIHSDHFLTISGNPTINIGYSYEAIEAAKIDISGGYTSVSSADDGVNAANGDFGESSKDYPYELNISGGYLFINAGGDGLDSNGDLTISGGFTVVAGPTNNSNGQIDFGDASDDKLTVSGGVIIAYGSGGMMNFNSSKIDSQQNTFFLGSTSCSTSNYYVIADSNGTIVSAIKPIKTSASLFMSSPVFAKGNYSVYIASSVTTTKELWKQVYSISGFTPVGSAKTVQFSNSTGSYFGEANNNGQGGGGRR